MLKSKMPDLVPCCYCQKDKELVIVEYKGKLSVHYRVRCCSCGALGPQSVTKKGAVDWWNSRHVTT